MSNLSISVNGRNYVISCEDGQEEHLARLADYINKRVAELVESVGQVGETRLLLMTSLLMADELADSYAALAAARGDADPGLLDTLPNGGGDAADATEQVAAVEADAAAVLEKLAERLEALAGKLEQAGV